MKGSANGSRALVELFDHAFHLLAQTGVVQVLVPFHEDLILSVEESTQTITLSLPEGILDLD